MDPIESFEQKICNGKLKNIKGKELPVSPGMEDLISLRRFLIQWLIIEWWANGGLCGKSARRDVREF
jgi:hypothetical protein